MLDFSIADLKSGTVNIQEREYKSQQKNFHIPFGVSKFTESDQDFLACSISNTQNQHNQSLKT